MGRGLNRSPPTELGRHGVRRSRGHPYLPRSDQRKRKPRDGDIKGKKNQERLHRGIPLTGGRPRENQWILYGSPEKNVIRGTKVQSDSMGAGKKGATSHHLGIPAGDTRTRSFRP